jgi:catalase
MKTRSAIAAIACLLPLIAGATTASAQDAPLPQQIVDSLNKAFGVHPGYRANHAKGIVAEGTFKASTDAPTLSKAVIFNGAVIPITVRFSNSTGIPDLPDGSDFANPHGMAIKYHLPDGSETDMVINSLKFFPVANGEEFRDLFLALAASPPTAPHPNPFETFMAAHPVAVAAFGTVATPDSFADEEYYGIDAFVFVDAAGHKQAVRYQMVPDKLVHIAPADAAARAPDFLMTDLRDRLRLSPITFHLKAQLAAPGDVTADPTKPWPDTNKLVDLGVLTITRVVPDSEAVQKTLLFLPGRLTDGIALSDDTLVTTRNGAYAVSFSRRVTSP